MLVAGGAAFVVVVGFGYTAFVIDAYAGLIPGWECSLSMQTVFVERALRHAAADVGNQLSAKRPPDGVGSGLH